MSTLTALLLIVFVALVLWRYFGEQLMAMPIISRMMMQYFGVQSHDSHTHHDAHGHAEHGAHGPASSEHVRLVVYVPVAYSDIVRDSLAHAGAGTREGYVSESFAVRGLGRWKKAASAAHSDHGPHHAHGHDDHGHSPDADHHDFHEEHESTNREYAETETSEFVYAEEDRIEAVVAKNHLPAVLSELRKLHVSSHMAIDTYPVELH